MKINLREIFSSLSLVISVFLMGCIPVNDRQLPNGTYRSAEGNQHIVVQGKDIYFHIFLDDTKTNYFDRGYKNHCIWQDGQIQAYPMRDVDAVLGVGKYKWIWDGTNILKQNSKSESTLFIPDK